MIQISQSKLTDVFNRLYSWIGSFWSKIYTDPKFIQHVQVGRSLRVAQLYLDLLENLNLMNRNNLPVFHRERWYPIIIRKSEEGKGDINSLRVGPDNHAVVGPQPEGSIYGEGTVLSVGSFSEFVDVETYPIHGKIDNIATCIVDSIVSPKTILRKGVDFILDYNCIGIYKEHSPFGPSSTFPIFERIEDGDLETVLWACDALIDDDYVNDYLGYIIGAAVESSEDGKRLVNSYWDMINYANPHNLNTLLGGLCKVPVIKDDVETVEVIFDNAVVTDKNVYRFDSYTPEYRDRVVVGAQLKKGEFLDKAIKVFPFLTDLAKHMEYDPEEELVPVHIPKEIIKGAHSGYNATWDTMTWEQFLTEFKEATGASFNIGDCTFISPTDTIEPATFFLENVIGANTLFIKIDGSKIVNAPIYRDVYAKLVQETIPKYIRAVIIISFRVGDGDVCNNTSDNVQPFSWKGLTDTTESDAVSDSVAYRLISSCAKL